MNHLLMIIGLTVALYLFSLIKMSAKIWGVIVLLLIILPETRLSVFPIFAVIVALQTVSRYREMKKQELPPVFSSRPSWLK